jgi:phosphoribosylformylglycinamidine cyclo-ligase
MEEQFTYEIAGISIQNADETKRELAKSMNTSDSRVLNRSGAFASLFEANFEGIKNPVLVLKAEEPGSKQLLAFQNNKINNICYDLINHLINDIIVMGAKPEVVLDIILCGKIEKDVVVQIVDAISNACKEQDCSLVGGETSEQPKVLNEGTYMLNASILGVVDKEKIIDGSKIEVGDVVLALPSNGLHTNGYTLVRKLMEEKPEILNETCNGESFIDTILTPHACYYQTLRGLFGMDELHGLAHITGGGIEGNLNRILPNGTSAKIGLDKVKVLPIFGVIKRYGNVPDSDMMHTFNMGVGITLVAKASAVEQIQEHLKKKGCESYIIGEIVSGDQNVYFEGCVNYAY